MRTLVYDCSGRIDWTDVALPDLQDVRDATVRVDAVTICGTTLRFLTRDVLRSSAAASLARSSRDRISGRFAKPVA